MEGLGQTQIVEKMKNATPAEKYSKSIEGQLGHCIKFKTEKFFAYSKRYPLHVQATHDFEKSVVIDNKFTSKQTKKKET